MSKTVLIAGKNSGDIDRFSDGLLSFSRQVVETDAISFPEVKTGRKTIAEKKAELAAFEEEKEIQSQSGICTFEWNKASALSARNLVLQAENFFERVDEAVLYFDEEFYASSAEKMDAAEISRTCDELILGFEYLATEILSRFERKYEDKPFSLVFLLKEGPNLLDVLRSPAIKNGTVAIASPLVAAAAAAFTSFAENIAALYGDESYVNIVLVRGDASMEEAKKDDSLAKWLAPFLDSLDELKSKLTAKKSAVWIKPGSKKAGGGFSLFRK
ncbi:hypothetical protein [Treponema sp.]|uniref:hypothetical protein n=1 Tax=Treponema sp. TaxID=166 RepID=UPI0025F484A4|nr:hypothetical protein [Treponema sp.]MCR5217822.1 hypothetical protein [Treponema sp.]